MAKVYCVQNYFTGQAVDSEDVNRVLDDLKGRAIQYFRRRYCEDNPHIFISVECKNHQIVNLSNSHNIAVVYSFLFESEIGV